MLTERMKQLLAFAALGLCALLIGGYALAFALEPDPVEYINDPFIVSDQPLEPGETFTFDIERCSRYPTQFTFTQEWIDAKGDIIIHFPSTLVSTDEGCNMVTSTPKEVPEELEAGEYRMKFTVVSRGHLRTHEQEVFTESIIIN